MSSHDPSGILTTYIPAVKKDVSDMINKPNYNKPNMIIEEREALRSLRKKKDVIIQSADKGGKIVLMDRLEYVNKCTEDLSNENFYKEVELDPTPDYVNDITQSISELKSENLITQNEQKFLLEHIKDPILPTLYGLPKIHCARQ